MFLCAVTPLIFLFSKSGTFEGMFVPGGLLYFGIVFEPIQDYSCYCMTSVY